MLSILIFTLLMKSTNGQLLHDDLGEQQKCVNVATHISIHELEQLTKSIGRNVKQNMEGIRSLDTNVRKMKKIFPEIAGAPNRSY